jgi:hypothetical protein
MVIRHRWVRGAAGFALAGALMAGCTSNGGVAGPASAALTPGGTAYPLSSNSAPASSSPPVSGSDVGSAPVGPTSVATTRPSSSGAAAPPTTVQPTGTSKTPAGSATTPKSFTKPSSSSSSVGLPTISGGALSAQEVKDRAAIQAVWVKYWDVYTRINDVPTTQRLIALNSVSVDPIRKKIVVSALKYDKDGLNTYGSVGHRIYWGPSVNGTSPAIMGDCLDTSRYGTVVVKTKAKQTVGYLRDNTRGVFVRLSDGQWRVQSVESLMDQAC